jgi:hypothetical protein
MSSSQSSEVLRRCISVSKDLEACGQRANGVAVLQALQVYFDILPAFSDASDRDWVSGILGRMAGRLHEEEKKA